MATVQTRLTNWALSELRGATQVNNDVLLTWYNKGYQIFQKALLEYVSNNLQTTTIYQDLKNWVEEYSLPFNQSNISDFYSIVQLRLAYDVDKEWNPKYRVCTPISLTDYNTNPKWRQLGQPIIWRRISKRNPRYSFITKWKLKIFPKPLENITNGICLTFNYFTDPVTLSTDESNLWVPRYFLDVIDDYLTYRLYRAENPELAAEHYEIFIKTLNDNIYGLNRDKRPIEEELANTSYFSHH